LTDDTDTIAKKIRKAKMDAEPVLPASEADFEGRPEVKNLYTLYAALAGVDMDKVFEEFGGRQEANGAFKAALADVAVAHLEPITARMNELLADPDEIDAILRKGSDKAAEIASDTAAQARKIMGLWE